MDSNIQSTPTGGPQYTSNTQPVEGKAIEQILLSLKAVDRIDPSAVAGEAVESYNAPPNNPSLPPKVKVDSGKKGTLAKGPNTTSISGQIQSKYNEYVKGLSPELQQSIKQALKQSPGSRDPEVNALMNTMQEQASLVTYAKAVHSGTITFSQVPIAMQKALLSFLQNGGQFTTDINAILAKTTPLTPEDMAVLTAFVDANGGSDNLKLQALTKMETAGQVSTGGTVAKSSAKGTQTVGGTQGTGVPKLGSLGLKKVDPKNQMPDQLSSSIRDNAMQVMDNTQALIKKTLDSIDPNDPNRPVLADFLAFVSKVISDCKGFMAHLASMDAEEGRKAAVGTREVQERKLEKQLKQIRESIKAKKKQATMGFLGKLLGPIFAVIMLCAVILTGGSVLAVLIAVAVLIAMLLDSATGIVSKGFKKLMQGIEGLFKALGLPDSVAKGLTAAVVVVAIIVLTVVAAGAASSGAASVARMVGQQTADKIAKSVAIGVAVNAGCYMATTTNCVAQLFKSFAEMCGADEQTAEIIGMIMQIIILLVAMLASGAAMGSAIKGAEGAISATRQVIADALNIGAQATQTATGLAKGVMSAQSAKLAMSQAELEKIIGELETFLKVAEVAKEDRNQGIATFMEMAQFFSDSFERLIKSHEKMLQGAMAA